MVQHLEKNTCPAIFSYFSGYIYFSWVTTLQEMIQHVFCWNEGALQLDCLIMHKYYDAGYWETSSDSCKILKIPEYKCCWFNIFKVVLWKVRYPVQQAFPLLYFFSQRNIHLFITCHFHKRNTMYSLTEFLWEYLKNSCCMYSLLYMLYVAYTRETFLSCLTQLKLKMQRCGGNS